jgi:hypothetical protein
MKNSPYTITVCQAGGRGQATSSAAMKAKPLFYTEFVRKRNLPEAEHIEERLIAYARIGLAGAALRSRIR